MLLRYQVSVRTEECPLASASGIISVRKGSPGGTKGHKADFSGLKKRAGGGCYCRLLRRSGHHVKGRDKVIMATKDTR